MRLATKTAGVAGGVLLAWFAAGCGAPAGHVTAGRMSTMAAHAASARNTGGGAPQATQQGCTNYGVYAIEHHITVIRTPAPCRGLSKAEINQAAARAIIRVAGGVRKAIWRKRAAEATPFLEHLFTAPAPVTSSLPAIASATSQPLGRKDLGMDIAALIAWLVTAGSGGYLLGSWLSHGGTLRSRVGATGSPPVVIIGHFSLALAGLVIWVIYLIAGWAALAWTAVGVLLPVAGLGMSALTVGLPGLPSLSRLPGRPVPAVAGTATTSTATTSTATATAGTATAGTATAGTATAGTATAGTATAGSAAPTGTAAADSAEAPAAADTPRPAVSARRRLSPLIVVGHGALAVTTMLLVLLAALGVAAG